MTNVLEDSTSAENKDLAAELPVFDFANAGEDYFSEIGHRRMALDMLIDAANTIMKDPDSKSAKHEWNWLLGADNNCVIPSPLCFDAISGGGIDVDDARRAFVKALNTNPKMLVKSLNLARVNITHGEFEVGSEEVAYYRVALSNQARPRSGG